MSVDWSELKPKLLITNVPKAPKPPLDWCEPMTIEGICEGDWLEHFITEDDEKEKQPLWVFKRIQSFSYLLPLEVAIQNTLHRFRLAAVPSNSSYFISSMRSRLFRIKLTVLLVRIRWTASTRSFSVKKRAFMGDVGSQKYTTVPSIISLLLLYSIGYESHPRWQ